MKKLKIVSLIALIFMLTACKKSDALLFKEEYEGLNNDSSYREVSIPEDNPIKYITDTELAKKVEAKEDMVVYFGFKECPWCRSIIETLLKASKDLNIDTIYYLDISEIRDTKQIGEDGKVTTTKEGSEGYNKLVSLLGDSLSDYKIGEEVVGKRIYAPNILVIKNKEVKGVIEGVSDLQTEPKMELTKEILDDSYSKIEAILKEYKSLKCDSSEGC